MKGIKATAILGLCLALIIAVVWPAMAALAEATVVQAGVAHQRQAFMWAQMVFAQATAPRR